MLPLGTDAVAAAAQTAVTACSPDTAQTDKDFEHIENIRTDNPRSLGVAWTVEDCDGTQTNNYAVVDKVVDMKQAGIEKYSDKGSANRHPEYTDD